MRCTYFAQRRARRPHHPLPPILPRSLLDSSKNMNKKDYTHIKTVLDSAMFTTANGVERSRTRSNGTAGPPSAIRPTSAASSNRVILLVMDSMSYTTCWSRDGIGRTFACHLHPAMPYSAMGKERRRYLGSSNLSCVLSHPA